MIRLSWIEGFELLDATVRTSDLMSYNGWYAVCPDDCTRDGSGVCGRVDNDSLIVFGARFVYLSAHFCEETAKGEE